MTEITRDEWLSALSEALKLPEGSGLTSAELCTQIGIGDDALLRRLKALKAQGRLEVTRGYRESIDGIMRIVPVYRITG